MLEKILIVDDDRELRSELKDLLDGYEVMEASNGEDALNILKRANEVGLVILDVMMPGMSGLDLLSMIKKTDPGLSTIILTGHSSKDVAIEALKGRADDYIEKPAEIDRIEEAVQRLLGKRPGDTEMGPPSIKEKLESVKRFIERNCYKKTNLKDAAAAVCISPKYLSRIFKQYLKTGFTEYKIMVKIDRSRDLLKKSGFNIDQISYKLGYENTESFIRQFKKITGKTPTEYRKKSKVKSVSARRKKVNKKRK